MLLAWQYSAACLARGAGAPVVRPPRLLWSRHSQLADSLLHIRYCILAPMFLRVSGCSTWKWDSAERGSASDHTRGRENALPPSRA